MNFPVTSTAANNIKEITADDSGTCFISFLLQPSKQSFSLDQPFPILPVFITLGRIKKVFQVVLLLLKHGNKRNFRIILTLERMVAKNFISNGPGLNFKNDVTFVLNNPTQYLT